MTRPESLSQGEKQCIHNGSLLRKRGGNEPCDPVFLTADVGEVRSWRWGVRLLPEEYTYSSQRYGITPRIRKINLLHQHVRSAGRPASHVSKLR
jgi:hypothetical protein